MFTRIAIVGTGLIGGSFALAVRRAQPLARIAGWDRKNVAEQTAARAVVDEMRGDLAGAVRDADLIYIATPIGAALDLLPAIAKVAGPKALVTDACSTKAAICAAAQKAFHGGAHSGARFLGGHPVAGKESGGAAAADADLFRGAKYALIAQQNDADARVLEFAVLLQHMGAQPVWMEAEAHDAAVAVISHLPQLLSVALAGVVRDATNESGVPMTLAGPGARDMLRLAGSPYEMWRDICLTNTGNIDRALERVAQAVEQLRGQLKSAQLREEFADANEVYKILQQLK